MAVSFQHKSSKYLWSYLQLDFLSSILTWFFFLFLLGDYGLKALKENVFSLFRSVFSQSLRLPTHFQQYLVQSRETVPLAQTWSCLDLILCSLGSWAGNSASTLDSTIKRAWYKPNSEPGHSLHKGFHTVHQTDPCSCLSIWDDMVHYQDYQCIWYWWFKKELLGLFFRVQVHLKTVILQCFLRCFIIQKHSRRLGQL